MTKNEVLPIWNGQKSIISDLEYFEMWCFQVIGRKFLAGKFKCGWKNFFWKFDFWKLLTFTRQMSVKPTFCGGISAI